MLILRPNVNVKMLVYGVFGWQRLGASMILFVIVGELGQCRHLCVIKDKRREEEINSV